MRNWGVGFSFSLLFLLYLSQLTGISRRQPIFLSPLLIWFYFKPDKKSPMDSSSFEWLFVPCIFDRMVRHVTYPGMVFASIILTLYNLPWFLLAHRWLQIVNSPFLVRLLLILGLSSFWVLSNGSGVSFLLASLVPISVTQWERPAILQLVPFFGG